MVHRSSRRGETCCAFVSFFGRSKKSFEVVQAYLHRFLKHYSDLIMAKPELREMSKALRDEQVR